VAEFVDQKFSCVVTEANPARGNLVLSRRAVLEREQAAEKERLMQSLEVGQVREGVVRNIRDFGAFVDLGGVDGLVHISKLSWDRIGHPSDVLEEGQRVQVKIEKIDEATGKISLSYRDLLEHPWEQAAQKYHENDIVTGTVSRIADFGAFVKLEAGVEGLVHVSELAHHRVQRVDTVVKEGQEVQVKILSIDPDSQRMSLSLKAVQGPPPEDDKTRRQTAEEEPPRARATKPHRGPLKGGTNRPTGGEQFGLNW
jgi:small subunit ribosomal protein S1